MVDVDSHFSDQLRRDVLVVLLDVGHPVVGCVGSSVAMTEYEDRARRRECLGDVLPVLGAIVLIRSRGVAGVVAHLVKPPTRIGSDNARRPLAWPCIRGVDIALSEGD